MPAPGSFASVQAADLPAGVDQQRAEPALVSSVVSFSYVRTRSACPTEDGQPRSRTVATYAVPSRADLESELRNPRANGPTAAPNSVGLELGNCARCAGQAPGKPAPRSWIATVPGPAALEKEARASPGS